MNNHTKTTSTGIALVPLLIFETCISPEVKLRSGKIFVAFYLLQIIKFTEISEINVRS